MNAEPQLLFEESTHTYTLRRTGFADLILPSVSEIIEVLHAKDYAGIPDKIMDNAADRGTRVHRAIEFWNKHRFRNVDDDFYGFFDAYLKFRQEHANWDLLHSEHRSYHKSLLYGMTADEIYQRGNEIILLDIKTPQKALLKTWAVQLGGYVAGLESGGMKINECCILQLFNDGHYILHPVKSDFGTFLSCYTIFNFHED